MRDGSPEKQSDSKETKAEREKNGEGRKLRLDVKELAHTCEEANKSKIHRGQSSKLEVQREGMLHLESKSNGLDGRVPSSTGRQEPFS